MKYYEESKHINRDCKNEMIDRNVIIKEFIDINIAYDIGGLSGTITLSKDRTCNPIVISIQVDTDYVSLSEYNITIYGNYVVNFAVNTVGVYPIVLISNDDITYNRVSIITGT